MKTVLRKHKNELLVQQEGQTASVWVQAGYVTGDMWCVQTNVLVMLQLRPPGSCRRSSCSMWAFVRPPDGEAQLTVLRRKMDEDGWRWMKMDEDGWRCCRVRNSAGILLFSPQLRGWNTSMSRAVVPSSPWTLTHAVLLHKHSARHQTWIHPPLKIVPDRNSASSCLCDRTCELSATDRKLLRLVNNSRPVAVLWLNCFMFLMLRLLLVVESLITCSSGVCEQKHTETFQASILSQYVT